MTTTIARMVQRRDTETNWAAYNPVLREGELGYDTTNDRFKIGDGVLAWTDLPYALTTEVDAAQAAAAAAAAAAADATAAVDSLAGAIPQAIEQHNLAAMRAFHVAAAKAYATGANPVDVFHFGDSITEGWYGTSSDENSMTATVLRSALARYFNPSQRFGRWIPAGGNWYPTLKFSANTGSSVEINQGISLRGRSQFTADGPATATVVCDRILVHYRLRNVFGATNIVIKIDGVTVLDTTTFKNTGTYCSTAFGSEVAVFDSGALTRGSHTLSVEAKTVSSATEIRWDGAYFCDGDYAAGLRYWNGAHFGYSLSTMNANNIPGTNTGWASVIRQGLTRPALVICSHGVNEGIDPVVLENNLNTWLNDLWGFYDTAGVPRCSVVLEIPYAASTKTAGQWEPMRQKFYEVALARGCAVWDWNELTGNVSSATGDPFSLTTDNIHLTSDGQRMRGLWLASKITRYLPAAMAAKILADMITVGGGGLVSSVNGVAPDLSGDITLTKANIGLGSAENTADADKPVSDDTQAALDLKVGTLNGLTPTAGVLTLPASSIPSDTTTVQDDIDGLASLVNEKAAKFVRTWNGTSWTAEPTAGIHDLIIAFSAWDDTVGGVTPPADARKGTFLIAYPDSLAP